MQHLRFPSRLDLEPSLKLKNEIALLPEDSLYAFDLTDLNWVHPFGMLFTAQALKDLKRRYPDSKVRFTVNSEASATTYAAHMGFFGACGFDYGNKPGFRTISSTYIPITYAHASQLQSTKEIEDISRELAEQLTQATKGVLVDALEYSFREMIRNVIEHSQSRTLGYCAQYWPTKNLVELAILDTGIGLRKSLSHNPYLDLTGDQDALKYALMPGISGKTYSGVRLRPNDAWQNSGYGLYMNYRLCNEGGSFFICSGNRGLYRAKTIQENRYYQTDFAGTALRLRLNTDQIRDVNAMLKQFSSEGEALAREIGKGAIPTASSMSKMLRENFQSLITQLNIGDRVKHKQYGVGTIETKTITPQGEMLRVQFEGGRSKKLLSNDVIKWDTDAFRYHSSDIAFSDEDILIDVDQLDTHNYHSEDYDFNDLYNE